jgi:hypothetical protein
MAVTQQGKNYARKIENDETPEQAIAVFKAVMDSLLPGVKDEADCYVFTSYQVLSEWLVMTDEFMPTHGFRRKAILLWKKEGPGMGDTNCPWGMGSEFILFFQRGPREKTWVRQNNVIEVPQLRPNELIHPHQKPPLLLKKLIKTSTVEGDFIVDPFGGSGSLVKAAREENRNAIAIELNLRNYEEARKFIHESETSLF